MGEEITNMGQLIKKLDEIGKQVTEVSNNVKQLREQKKELITCLCDVAKEVRAAGGHYLVDKIVACIEKVRDEDLQQLIKQRAAGL